MKLSILLSFIVVLALNITVQTEAFKWPGGGGGGGQSGGRFAALKAKLPWPWRRNPAPPPPEPMDEGGSDHGGADVESGLSSPGRQSSFNHGPPSGNGRTNSFNHGPPSGNERTNSFNSRPGSPTGSQLQRQGSGSGSGRYSGQPERQSGAMSPSQSFGNPAAGGVPPKKVPWYSKFRFGRNKSQGGY